MDHRYGGEFRALAGALEADDLLIAVEVGDPVPGASPGMGG